MGRDYLPPKVLITDDEPQIRYIIKESVLLLIPDATIIEATDGLDATLALKQNAPDIVLSDINMPNLDGISFLRNLREIKKDPIFIIISACVDESSLLSAVRYGAFDIIEKPFLGSEFDDVIKRAVSFFEYRRSMLDQVENSLKDCDVPISEINQIFSFFNSINNERYTLLKNSLKDLSKLKDIA